MNLTRNAEINFDKFSQEANEYIKELADQLGHSNEEARVLIVWRSVMHMIRERIHISESLDLISSLPMLLKGMYVHNWKYHDKPPLDFDSMEGLINAVKNFQSQYGEIKFDWNQPTEKIISTTIHSLGKYLSRGQIEHIKGQMPQEAQAVF